MVGGRAALVIARGGMAAAVASAIALGVPPFALGQNYCIGHSTADGCNVRASGPHITGASISHGRLHLKLTFHKAGQFVAHLKQNPPPEPYDRDWARDPGSASQFESDSIRRDPGP